MRSTVNGLTLGVLMGALWFGVETLLQWAAGSLVPAAVTMDMGRWTLGIAAVAGALFGTVLRERRVAVAFAVVMVFGLLRVYAPPGYVAEGVFLGLAVVATALGTLIVGSNAGGWLVGAQIAVLAAATYSAFEIYLNESHIPGLHGMWLPLSMAVLPLVPMAIDRVLGFGLRSRPVRFGLEVAALAAGVALYARPLSTVPFTDPTVTGVPPAEGTPDIYLVTFDTTRADHLSLYGYARDTTPRLKEFGEDALVFDNAHSAAGWTLPGHSSIFTGLYPTWHGARSAGGWLPGQSVDGRRNVAYPLAEDKITLAEELRDHGYNTAGVVANFSYLYRSFGFAQGFQSYDDAPWRLLRFYTPLMHFVHNRHPGYFLRPYRTGHDINAAGLAWLDAASPGRPSFLFLNYMDPHPPYLAPEGYTQFVDSLPFAAKMAEVDLYSHDVRNLKPEEREYITACYDDQVRAADAAFGEFIAALKQRGRYDNALIIMTSDHGELLGDHDHVGHIGRMLYEGLLHIPMVIKFPGKDHPRGRVKTAVQNVDVFPTALSIAGVTPPPGTQGQAMPAVTHPIMAEEDVNAFLVSRYGKQYDRAIRVLIEGDYKYIVTSTGEKLLFDTATDGTEDKNLTATDPARADAMSKRLGTLLPFGPPPPATAAAGPAH